MAHRGLLSSLFKALALKKRARQASYDKMGALGPSEGLSPSLVRKLGRWLQQVAHLEKEESDIISEIDFVERRHRERRRRKAVRRAAPLPARAARLEQEAPEAEPERPTRRLWAWVLLFLAAAPRPQEESLKNE